MPQGVNRTIQELQFFATPPRIKKRPTPENDREGSYCRKSTESDPEWPSVAKFPPLDASIMARQIFPRGDRSGEIWNFREVWGGRGSGKLKSCKIVNAEKGTTR
jgi:hypothetical protein